jgi:hypothetical protein
MERGQSYLLLYDAPNALAHKLQKVTVFVCLRHCCCMAEFAVSMLFKPTYAIIQICAIRLCPGWHGVGHQSTPLAV